MHPHIAPAVEPCTTSDAPTSPITPLPSSVASPPTPPEPNEQHRRADAAPLAEAGALTAPTVEAPVVPGYEILGVLGRGGTGVVYKARQVGLDRVVALKVLLLGPHADEEVRRRFVTEAHAVARIAHPNIVQIYEIGTTGETPFYTMEYCPRGNLVSALHGRPCGPRHAAALVCILARAVQAAHDAKVIHRDLKPANVLIAADGTLKLSDFGLARKLDATTQTITGAVLGTPAYMAPEQVRGQTGRMGPATDVYGLGVLFYELLTGRPPFHNGGTYDTLEKVVRRRPILPGQIVPGLPEELDRLCMHCLEKDPEKRPARAAEVADRLQCWLDAPQRRERLLSRFAFALALAAVVVLAAAIAWPLLGRWPADPTDHALPQAQGGNAGFAGAPADEARKIHVLMVLQSISPDLAPALQVDEDRFTRLLKDNVPSERYTLTVLRGAQATRDRILEHYVRQRVGPDEGLVFYYGGTGGKDPRNGYYLGVRDRGKRPLLRSELHQAMQRLRPRFALVLADATCNPAALTARDLVGLHQLCSADNDEAPAVEAGPAFHPTVRSLLFGPRGLIDINGADETSSAWSDWENGGVFTRALCALLTREHAALDSDGDSRLSWREVFPRLQRDTQEVFDAWATQMRGRGEKVKDRTQRPLAIALGADRTRR